MSPVRVEKTDPVGGLFTAAWRPQEALGAQVLDRIATCVGRVKYFLSDQFDPAQADARRRRQPIWAARGLLTWSLCWRAFRT